MSEDRAPAYRSRNLLLYSGVGSVDWASSRGDNPVPPCRVGVSGRGPGRDDGQTSRGANDECEAMGSLAAIVVLAAGGSRINATEPANRLVIHADQGTKRINRNIYGHFSEHLGHCIYGGYWVGESSSIPNTRGIRNDIVEALKKSKIPVLRWPGGCFADEYHWMDGIGPREKRPTMINTHWGGVTENNHFGTHEFFDLCEQLGCEPYICGNVGSGTVREMQQWVEYMTSDGVSPMTDLRKQNGREKPWKLTYFGVGNENWGCGGSMTPAYYADLFRRYATYVRNFGGNRIQKIASGPNKDDFKWTETLMREEAGTWPAWRFTITAELVTSAVRQPISRKATGSSFSRKALWMDHLLSEHSRIMDELRSPQTRGPDRRRVGRLAPGRAGHEPRVSLSAEHPSRRPGGGRDSEHLQPALRPRADGQHRPDHQRASGHDPDRQGEDAADADLSRLRDVLGPPGRHAAAFGADLRKVPARFSRIFPG